MALQYLFAPTTQFQARTGANNTAGFLRVFYTQSDDEAHTAPTYCDFGGTLNPADIILDADGRAVVIVDDAKTYRLEVYNRNHGLLFTIDPLTAMGGGAGGSNVVQVISSDGTVSVESTSAGGVRYFDLSTAIDETMPSKWGIRTGSATSVAGDDEWHELGNWVDIGTTSYYGGWKLFVKGGYDLAASLEMVQGDASALKTVDVMFVAEVDGVERVREYGIIDPSKGKDRVSFEWKGDGEDGQMIDGRIFVKSDVAMNLNLVSRVMYNEECDGIIGNGSGGGDYIGGDYIDIVGTIINATGLQPVADMSAYALTADMSAKMDASASSLFYPTSNPSGFITGVDLSDYATTSYVDSSVSGKLDTSAFTGYTSTALTGMQNDISALSSMVSSISGQTGDFVEKSSISSESSTWNTVTAKLDSSAFNSGDFYSTSNPSGFITGVDLSDYATTGYVDSSVSSKLDTSAFTGYTATALTGLENDVSSLSSMVSAISGQTGDFVEKSSISAESSTWNTVTAKLDSSAFNSGDFYPTSNPSGFITGVDLSDYATIGYVDSSVSSKLDESAFTGYTATALTAIEDDVSALSSMVSAISGQTGNYVEKSSISSESSTWNTVTAKMDSSSSGMFYPSSNPSGFITGVDLSDYATTSYVDSSVSSKLDESAFTGYTSTALTGIENDVSALSSIVSSISGQTGDFVEKSSISAESASWNDVSAKLDASATSDFYPTSNPSGFLAGITHDNTLTGDGINSSPLGVNRLELIFDQTMSTSNSGNSAIVGVNMDILSGYQSISGMTGYIPTSESANYYSTSNPSGFITGVDLTPYQLTADMSGYLGTAESANYYPADNPSGFITGVDLSEYATTGYVESSVSGKYDASASGAFYPSSNPSGFITGVDLTPYQLTADMSGYLGTAESANYYPMTGNPSGFLTSVDLSDYATTAYVDSSVSGKFDASASGEFYPSGNPSGFITGVDLAPYQLTADMSGYLQTSESANYYPMTGNPSGFLTEHQELTGYIPVSALGIGEI